MNGTPRRGPEPAERAELARLLPPPGGPDLSSGRHDLLKEHLMSQIQKQSRPKKRLLRPRVLAPVLAAAAAVSVGAPMLLGGAEAYAVTKRDDGTIEITINEAKNPKKLEADLRSMGLNAVVDYIPTGKKCSPQPRSRGFVPKEKAPLSVWPAQGDGFTVDPRVVKPGQTAVLEFSVSDDQKVAGIWARVSNGPVASCELADSDGAPLGPPLGG